MDFYGFVSLANSDGGVPIIKALGVNSIFNIVLSYSLIKLSAKRIRRLK